MTDPRATLPLGISRDRNSIGLVGSVSTHSRALNPRSFAGGSFQHNKGLLGATANTIAASNRWYGLYVGIFLDL